MGVKSGPAAAPLDGWFRPSSQKPRLGSDVVVLDRAVDDIVEQYIATNTNSPTRKSSAASLLLPTRDHLRQKLRTPQSLVQEFAALEALQLKLNATHSCEVGKLALKANLNRYLDVLPYDHNRITLGTTNTAPVQDQEEEKEEESESDFAVDDNTTTTNNNNKHTRHFGNVCANMVRAAFGSSSTSPRKENESAVRSASDLTEEQRLRIATYINASPITCTDPSTSSSWQYIAAQGPLPQTTHSFWQMIVEQRISSVVMVTGLVENKKKKCHQYFASKLGTKLTVDDGTVVKTVAVEEVGVGLVMRRLLWERKTAGIGGAAVETSTRWECDHYHFTSWPDHGVPSSPAVLLELCALMRKHEQQHDDNVPILVHCSAGIGRSGVFCVLDSIARRLYGFGKAYGTSSGTDPSLLASDVGPTNKLMTALAVDEMVATLRNQRAGMVQTPEQYVFCYRAVLHLVEAVLERCGVGGDEDDNVVQ